MACVYGAKQIQICHLQRGKARLKIYIGLALPYLAVAAAWRPYAFSRNLSSFIIPAKLSHFIQVHPWKYEQIHTQRHTTRLLLWWCIIINIFQKVLYFTLGKFMKSVTAFTIVIYLRASYSTMKNDWTFYFSCDVIFTYTGKATVIVGMGLWTRRTDSFVMHKRVSVGRGSPQVMLAHSICLTGFLILNSI